MLTTRRPAKMNIQSKLNRESVFLVFLLIKVNFVQFGTVFSAKNRIVNFRLYKPRFQTHLKSVAPKNMIKIVEVKIDSTKIRAERTAHLNAFKFDDLVPNGFRISIKRHS